MSTLVTDNITSVDGERTIPTSEVSQSVDWVQGKSITSRRMWVLHDNAIYYAPNATSTTAVVLGVDPDNTIGIVALSAAAAGGGGGSGTYKGELDLSPTLIDNGTVEVPDIPGSTAVLLGTSTLWDVDTVATGSRYRGNANSIDFMTIPMVSSAANFVTVGATDKKILEITVDETLGGTYGPAYLICSFHDKAYIESLDPTDGVAWSAFSNEFQGTYGSDAFSFYYEPGTTGVIASYSVGGAAFVDIGVTAALPIPNILGSTAAIKIDPVLGTVTLAIGGIEYATITIPPASLSIANLVPGFMIYSGAAFTASEGAILRTDTVAVDGYIPFASPPIPGGTVNLPPTKEYKTLPADVAVGYQYTMTAAGDHHGEYFKVNDLIYVHPDLATIQNVSASSNAITHIMDFQPTYVADLVKARVWGLTPTLNTSGIYTENTQTLSVGTDATGGTLVGSVKTTASTSQRQLFEFKFLNAVAPLHPTNVAATDSNLSFYFGTETDTANFGAANVFGGDLTATSFYSVHFSTTEGVDTIVRLNNASAVNTAGNRESTYTFPPIIGANVNTTISIRILEGLFTIWVNEIEYFSVSGKLPSGSYSGVFVENVGVVATFRTLIPLRIYAVSEAFPDTLTYNIAPFLDFIPTAFTVNGNPVEPETVANTQATLVGNVLTLNTSAGNELNNHGGFLQIPTVLDPETYVQFKNVGDPIVLNDADENTRLFIGLMDAGATHPPVYNKFTASDALDKSSFWLDFGADKNAGGTPAADKSQSYYLVGDGTSGVVVTSHDLGFTGSDFVLDTNDILSIVILDKHVRILINSTVYAQYEVSFNNAVKPFIGALTLQDATQAAARSPVQLELLEEPGSVIEGLTYFQDSALSRLSAPSYVSTLPADIQPGDNIISVSSGAYRQPSGNLLVVPDNSLLEVLPDNRTLVLKGGETSSIEYGGELSLSNLPPIITTMIIISKDDTTNGKTEIKQGDALLLKPAGNGYSLTNLSRDNNTLSSGFFSGSVVASIESDNDSFLGNDT